MTGENEKELLVEQVAAAMFDFAERRAHSFATWTESVADWRRESFRARARDTIDALGLELEGGSSEPSPDDPEVWHGYKVYRLRRVEAAETATLALRVTLEKIERLAAMDDGRPHWALRAIGAHAMAALEGRALGDDFGRSEPDGG